MSSDNKEKRLIRKGRMLFTISGIDGRKRPWFPAHSKLAALILKDREFTIENLEGNVSENEKIKRILYLGGGHGTTVSHLSDLFPDAEIFVVEFGPSMYEIMKLAGERNNVFPIMEDAAQVERYASLFRGEPVDLLYQDIAQRDQVGILVKNIRFLKNGGRFIFMLKVRSMDQGREKGTVALEILKELEGISDLKMDDFTDLSPYQKDHYAFVGGKE